MGIPAYAIFEGGGMKGLGHVAAMKAVENNDIELVGVAGASAGALIAALVAVGYEADELFDSRNPQGNLLTVNGITPLSLIGRDEWRTFSAAQREGPTAISALFGGGVAWAWFRAGSAIKVVNTIRSFGGYFSTAAVCEQLNEFLKSKLERHHANNGSNVVVPPRVRFRDIDPALVPQCCSLKVVVTDVTNRRMVVFDSRLPEFADVEVAEVVSASIAIPMVFKPPQIPSYAAGNGAYYADGGLVSNLPVWIFSEEKLNYERSELPNARVPILGFSLTGDPAGAAPPEPGSIAWWTAVGRTAVFGGQSVAQRFVGDLLPIDIPIGLGVTEFDFTLQRGLSGYNQAYNAAMLRLKREIRDRPTIIRRHLATLEAAVLQVIATHARSLGPPGPLRVAVLRPERRDPLRESLRIIYSHNMDGDADDRLSFRLEMEGASTAFRTKGYAYLDFAGLLQAGQAPYMTKYEYALVRRDRSSAICVPLFEDPSHWGQPVANRTPFGVVSIDSAESLTHIFSDQAAMTAIVNATLPLAAAVFA